MHNRFGSTAHTWKECISVLSVFFQLFFLSFFYSFFLHMHRRSSRKCTIGFVIQHIWKACISVPFFSSLMTATRLSRFSLVEALKV